MPLASPVTTTRRPSKRRIICTCQGSKIHPLPSQCLLYARHLHSVRDARRSKALLWVMCSCRLGGTLTTPERIGYAIGSHRVDAGLRRLLVSRRQTRRR